ncbi:hypothetical protein COOONC_23325, partial [Cooperia oncophora]
MTSKTCSICGSTQTTIMDGLMYCATCGTQIFDFREVEADDDGIVCGTAKGEVLEGYRSERSSTAKSSELAKDYTTGKTHAPAYLRTIGVRISTFTKMLAKGAAMISEDKAVPRGFSDHVFATYQRYLSACNVAFTSNDYTEESEHMFRAVVLSTNLALTRAREKKETKVRRKKRGKDALEKSTTAWELLMSNTINEDLEMHSDEEEPIDNAAEPTPSSTTTTQQSKLVNVVETNIPEETLKNASSLFLSMDVLAAILYISTVTIGCRWIMLSDIVRWLREGRLGISLFQLAALHAGRSDDPRLRGQNWWTRL